MMDDQKFDFTTEGEVFGYISLDQARLRVMEEAGQNTGSYGNRYRNIDMAFDVVEAIESEDLYTITLSFRPEGDFIGTAGQEQFVVEKEGRIAIRQVLSLPKPTRRQSRLLPSAVVLAVVGVIIVVSVMFGTIRNSDSDRYFASLTGAAGGVTADELNGVSPDAVMSSETDISNEIQNTSTSAVSDSLVWPEGKIRDASNVETDNSIIPVESSSIFQLAGQPQGESVDLTLFGPSLEAMRHFQKGESWRADREWELAIESFSQAILLSPNFRDAYLQRGITYHYDKSFHDKAVQDFNEVIRLDPNGWEGYSHRGRAYRSSGLYEEAIYDFRRTLELGSNNPEDQMEVGVAYYDLGEFDEALEELSKAVLLDPGSPHPYQERGRVYERLNEPQLALKDWEMALRFEPENPWLYKHRGMAYVSLGDYDKAMEDYNKALEIDPGYSDIYDYRGRLYGILGLYEEERVDRAKFCALESGSC